jgi:hypothetical protein
MMLSLPVSEASPHKEVSMHFLSCLVPNTITDVMVGRGMSVKLGKEAPSVPAIVWLIRAEGLRRDPSHDQCHQKFRGLLSAYNQKYFRK